MKVVGQHNGVARLSDVRGGKEPPDVLKDIIWAVSGRGFGPISTMARFERRSPILGGTGLWRSNVQHACPDIFENTWDMH